MSGVGFLYSGGLSFLFIVEILPSGWGWMIGFSRFPGYGSLCLCCCAWNWISSLWSAMEFSVMSFSMGLCLRCDFGQPVYLHSGLCSCIAKEFVWYVLFWSLLALGWWLVLV